MSKRVLILGHTGKMGIALMDAFSKGYVVVGKNSRDFDAENFYQLRDLVNQERPDIVINTIAFLGIDSCEQDPLKAFRLNGLYPQNLAKLSVEKRFTLVHFSTDAVFNDGKNDFYVEGDMPCPLNVYGVTKYNGDCFIQSTARDYYIFRLPLLFGEAIKSNQFVEKMLQKVREGAKRLKISSDIISSPSYSKDIAARVREVVESGRPSGIYHVANEGKTSLYELMQEIIMCLGMDVVIEKASFHDFPYVGRKNTNTPIKSDKIPPLRHWKEAVKEYCDRVKANY